MASNAQAILESRMAEVRERKASKQAAIQELFMAYPDIKEWAKDLADNFGPLQGSSLRWVVNGPMWQPGEYVVSVLGSHRAPALERGKKGRE
jgi:hypothetical protein